MSFVIFLALQVHSAETTGESKNARSYRPPAGAVDGHPGQGASEVGEKPTEAPSSVTVITSERDQEIRPSDLADVLQSVQGFHVSYDRNYAFLGARGVSLGDFNSRILLLVDGHRVNNNLTDGATLIRPSFSTLI